MNIYVAGDYHARHAAEDFARSLRSLDLRVVSRWHENNNDDSPDVHQWLPLRTIDTIASGRHTDLARADTFVLLSRAGLRDALVELGVAFGRGMRVLIVGGMPTGMSHHERVWWCGDEQVAFDILTRLAGRGRPMRTD